MKISISNLKNKLKNGWELMTSEGRIFSVFPDEEIEVQVIDGNIVDIKTTGTGSGAKRMLKEATIVALRHSNNHSRSIAIDKVLIPKQDEIKKRKVRIIVGRRTSAFDQTLALYIYYKAIKAKGSDSVSIASYNWQWVDGSPEKPFKTLVGDTKDTEIICCGFKPSSAQLNYIDKCTLIPCLNYAYTVEKKIGSILTKLKTLGIYPELSMDDEKEKLLNLMVKSEYNTNKGETVYVFLREMLNKFTLETAAKILQNNKSKFGIKQAMDSFIESDNKDKLVLDLPLFSKDKKLKDFVKTNKISVSDYLICNAITTDKKTYLEIKADKDIYNDGYYFRVSYPIARIVSKLYPKTPIVLWTSEDRVDIYSNTDKLTPLCAKLLETIVSDVLKHKEIKRFEVIIGKIQ